VEAPHTNSMPLVILTVKERMPESSEKTQISLTEPYLKISITWQSYKTVPIMFI